MMIDRIFQTVKSLINTDGRGNFSPSDFNIKLNNAIQEKYEGYIVEINQAVNRENRGLINGGLENVADELREKLQHYLKVGTLTASGSNYTFPSDLKYFDTITTPEGNIIDKCKDAEEFTIVSRNNATKNFPVYLKVGNAIKVAPAITGTLSVTYLRKSLFPKWTFVEYNNAELFNPSASDFQDADIHESEEDDLVQRLLVKYGISLKEVDLQNAMNNSEDKEFNQNNAS